LVQADGKIAAVTYIIKAIPAANNIIKLATPVLEFCIILVVIFFTVAVGIPTQMLLVHVKTQLEGGLIGTSQNHRYVLIPFAKKVTFAPNGTNLIIPSIRDVVFGNR
jgi:hypothetical protein